MGTGVAPPLGAPGLYTRLTITFKPRPRGKKILNEPWHSDVYGAVPKARKNFLALAHPRRLLRELVIKREINRPISTARLKPLRALHLPPIKPLVSRWSIPLRSSGNSKHQALNYKQYSITKTQKGSIGICLLFGFWNLIIPDATQRSDT